MDGENNLTEESPPTSWVYEMMKTNASNDIHETLISKWKYWTNTKGILRNIFLGGRYDGS